VGEHLGLVAQQSRRAQERRVLHRSRSDLAEYASLSRLKIDGMD
jgi:hypothetical protein